MERHHYFCHLAWFFCRPLLLIDTLTCQLGRWTQFSEKSQWVQRLMVFDAKLFQNGTTPSQGQNMAFCIKIDNEMHESGDRPNFLENPGRPEPCPKWSKSKARGHFLAPSTQIAAFSDPSADEEGYSGGWESSVHCCSTRQGGLNREALYHREP